MRLSYSRVLVREIRGSWSLGAPDPVWRKPHSVQYFCCGLVFGLGGEAEGRKDAYLVGPGAPALSYVVLSVVCCVVG